MSQSQLTAYVLTHYAKVPVNSLCINTDYVAIAINSVCINIDYAAIPLILYVLTHVTLYFRLTE